MVYEIRVSLSALSVSLSMQIQNFGLDAAIFAKAKDFVQVAECNQDLVAPAPSYIPIEIVCVRLREHPHRERIPSGVVFWAGSDKDALVLVRQNE